MTQGGEEQNLDYRQARIRQANALTKSGQELDLNEKRLLLLAMARIKSSDTELLTHKIGMRELEAHIGANPYARAERAARGLLRRLVYVPTENGGFKEFQWTTVAEYVPAESSETGESYVWIRLNEELAPLLLTLRERYNTIPLLDVLPMESFNGQRLYEVLWHDFHGGEKRVLTYHVADLKFSMGMRVLEQKGSKKVWTEKYKAWRDFRKMLERASGEFEAHGRLRFTFDALRQGRAIQQVRFHLSLVGGGEPGVLPAGEGRPAPPEAVTAADALRTLGYVGDAEAFVAQHGHEVVNRALKLGRAAEARGSGSGRPITNLPGFVQHLVTSGAASRSLRLDAAGAKKPKRAAERELVEMVKNAYDEFETRNRAYLAEVLERAGWQGTQYELARNTYLLELYRDELPESAHDVGQFVAERDLLSAQPAEVAKRVLGALQDELRA